MSWKEYRLDSKTIADWLPWCALTHESVLRNKDDSVLGVIRYRPFAQRRGNRHPMPLPSFRRGWSIWIEEQYETESAVQEAACFFALCWNPFIRTGVAVNGLDDTQHALDDMEKELARVLHHIASTFPAEAQACVLSYQEVIDYLTFSLTLGRKKITMPEVPVDLDIFLTTEIDLDFTSNHVRLNEDVFLVLTLPSAFGTQEEVLHQMTAQLHAAGIPCRHVQRLLLFGKAEAEKELHRYTEKWCPSRKYIKELLTGDTLQALSGYYNNQLIVLTPKDGCIRVQTYLEKLLCQRGLPYIIEDYNAKDLWWGSLPGLFRAAVVPPICGFQTLEDLLAVKKEEGQVHVPT